MISARQLGQRLRGVRVAAGLSLQDVQAATGDEFKASALGAYERGQRALTVQRLSRLLDVYGIALTDFLREEPAERTDRTIDLVTLEADEHATHHDDEIVRSGVERLARWITARRGAASSARLRRADIEVVSVVLGQPVDRILALLEMSTAGAAIAPQHFLVR